MHILIMTISIYTVKNTSNLIFYGNSVSWTAKSIQENLKNHLPMHISSALVIPEQGTALPFLEIKEPTAGIVSPEVRPDIPFTP